MPEKQIPFNHDQSLHEVKKSLNDLGFKELRIGITTVYTLDFSTNPPTPEQITILREALSHTRVAVELGPTQNLSSLDFAAKKCNADVAIGIDPFFDFTAMENLAVSSFSHPAIKILLKADGWGNQRINELFGTKDPRPSRTAAYAQLVCPDSDFVDQMMSATKTKSNSEYMCVLDSGAIAVLSVHLLSGIYRTLMIESGYTNPTELDWIKHLYRAGAITELSMEEYKLGMDEGKYPPTSYLRAGSMLIFTNSPPTNE